MHYIFNRNLSYLLFFYVSHIFNVHTTTFNIFYVSHIFNVLDMNYLYEGPQKLWYQDEDKVDDIKVRKMTRKVFDLFDRRHQTFL